MLNQLINLTMKCFRLVALFCTMLVGSASMNAQSSSVAIAKERQELSQMTKQELNERASKSARKAAKEYKKDDWMVAPGNLPIEKQLDRAYQMELQYDESGYPKYVTGEAQSVGDTFDAALMQANELARINLAESIQKELTIIAETNLANSQEARMDAASVVETIMASKSIVEQKLGRVIPIVELYRELRAGRKEVRVVIGYAYEDAMSIAKDALREELKNKAEELQEEVNALLNL